MPSGVCPGTKNFWMYLKGFESKKAKIAKILDMTPAFYYIAQRTAVIREEG